MTKRDYLYGGIGIGILITAFVAKVLPDTLWFILTVGLFLMVASGTGVLNKRQHPSDKR